MDSDLKVIAIHFQSFQSDHPTGDTDASGLNEAIRLEVQRVVSKIKFDIE